MGWRPSGKVYAIEKNQEALELLKQNKYRHKAWNLEIIAGEAPEALQTLFAPTHVFVGGSGGRLRELTALAWQKNPKLRLGLNGSFPGNLKLYPILILFAASMKGIFFFGLRNLFLFLVMFINYSLFIEVHMKLGGFGS